MPTRNTTPYTTVSDVKALAGITDTDQDALINTLIYFASDYIDARTRRWWSATTQTRYYDYQDSHKLRLDQDLWSLTSLTNGDGTTIATSDVILYPLSGPPYGWIEIDRSSSASFTYSNTKQKAIAVTGLWGASEAAPEIIVQACNLLVISALNRAAHEGLASVSAEFAKLSFARAEAENQIIAQALGNRRVRIG